MRKPNELWCCAETADTALVEQVLSKRRLRKTPSEAKARARDNDDPKQAQADNKKGPTPTKESSLQKKRRRAPDPTYLGVGIVPSLTPPLPPKNQWFVGEDALRSVLALAQTFQGGRFTFPASYTIRGSAHHTINFRNSGGQSHDARARLTVFKQAFCFGGICDPKSQSSSRTGLQPKRAVDTKNTS